MIIRGSVDLVNEKEAAGWAYCNKGKDKLNVQAVLNNEIIGEATADIFRADLASAGFGNGNCGFLLRYYRELHNIYLPFVVFKVDGGDVEIPRSSLTGYMEFLSGFYRQHSPAARQLSILGGGWPTRVDAISVLNGKLRIGEVTSDVHHSLLELLARGIAVVPNNGPLTLDADQPLVAAACSALDAGPLLDVLIAVFSDEPLAFSSAIVDQLQPSFVQPSAEIGLVTSNEAYAIVAPVGDGGIEIDVVRSSHNLPEFTAGGISRWTTNNANAGVEMALEQQGLLDRIAVPPGSRALIGPGTLYKVRGGAKTTAIKLLCVPVRVSHIKVADISLEYTSQTRPGLRIWVAQQG
jgi:hypothetical protein